MPQVRKFIADSESHLKRTKLFPDLGFSSVESLWLLVPRTLSFRRSQLLIKNAARYQSNLLSCVRLRDR
ncbi:hypothetical protein [Nostoc sp. UIC 10630]|uniref:hypothetical protein n=1 Tax=Nostoc sp. UIC 10630 TaxID=2100146 RepID=UPI0013D7CF0C|nr:hypothetical protein [Nostoc sp. UIC 10630]NEU82353.1 hypothetical protein [Nostoc sp. UIC 10630]